MNLKQMRDKIVSLDPGSEEGKKLIDQLNRAISWEINKCEEVLESLDEGGIFYQSKEPKL